MDYQDINSKTFDKWNKNSWEWGKPISHEEFLEAKKGNFKLRLTPTKKIPNSWLKDIKNKKVLALASGGGQQVPILSALGASVTLLDYSDSQLQSDIDFALLEGYKIETIKFDMTKGLPFSDATFDYIINPLSLCYIEDINGLFKECSRVLKRDGYFIGAFDNGLNYATFETDNELSLKYKLPFNPLKDEMLYNIAMLNEWGIQFSHTLEEQINALLNNNLMLLNVYEDTTGKGKLHELNIPSFMVVRAVKK